MGQSLRLEASSQDPQQQRNNGGECGVSVCPPSLTQSRTPPEREHNMTCCCVSTHICCGGSEAEGLCNQCGAVSSLPPKRPSPSPFHFHHHEECAIIVISSMNLSCPTHPQCNAGHLCSHVSSSFFSINFSRYCDR